MLEIRNKLAIAEITTVDHDMIRTIMMITIVDHRPRTPSLDILLAVLY